MSFLCREMCSRTMRYFIYLFWNLWVGINTNGFACDDLNVSFLSCYCFTSVWRVVFG